MSTDAFRTLRESGVVHVVGISEMRISARPQDVIVTYSLGSCVGLSIYDPVAKVGGMIHCMLPLSTMDVEKAQENPWMFVDTGVTGFLQELFRRGVTRRNLVAKVAGAAEIFDRSQVFRIGVRNHTVLRKVLWKNDILLAAEDIGGTTTRTLSLYMTTGQTTIRSGGEEVELARGGNRHGVQHPVG